MVRAAEQPPHHTLADVGEGTRRRQHIDYRVLALAYDCKGLRAKIYEEEVHVDVHDGVHIVMEQRREQVPERAAGDGLQHRDGDPLAEVGIAAVFEVDESEGHVSVNYRLEAVDEG